MKKVKITAVRRSEYPDLMELYEQPLQDACQVNIGDTWICVDGQKPEGFYGTDITVEPVGTGG
jgi:uncharacterized repeat protein (TIGR04076 family)